jgi:hypothetical protein
VVEMVSVPVLAVESVIGTGLVEPKLKVGRLSAPVGLEVTAAVKTTLPVKPPMGVTVMVEAFPVAAPRATVTTVPLMLKPGAGAAVLNELMVPLVVPAAFWATAWK